jgi:hypothetical protein
MAMMEQFASSSESIISLRDGNSCASLKMRLVPLVFLLIIDPICENSRSYSVSPQFFSKSDQKSGKSTQSVNRPIGRGSLQDGTIRKDARSTCRIHHVLDPAWNAESFLTFIAVMTTSQNLALPEKLSDQILII